MRENKFRVYCEFEIDGRLEKCMESPASWFLMTQTGKLWSYGPGEAPRPLEKEYKKAIPLFYTGLTDKDGVEIYEGDVLEYDGEKVECEKCGNKQLYYSSHKLYEIKWNEELCEFDCENDENSMSSCIWQTEMRVVGNIYEDRNLLNGK